MLTGKRLESSVIKFHPDYPPTQLLYGTIITLYLALLVLNRKSLSSSISVLLLSTCSFLPYFFFSLWELKVHRLNHWVSTVPLDETLRRWSVSFNWGCTLSAVLFGVTLLIVLYVNFVGRRPSPAFPSRMAQSG